MIPLKQKEERGLENRQEMKKMTTILLSKTFHRLSMIKVLLLKNPLLILKAALVH